MWIENKEGTMALDAKGLRIISKPVVTGECILQAMDVSGEWIDFEEYPNVDKAKRALFSILMRNPEGVYSKLK